MTDILKQAPVAYQNEPFIASPDGRILRILAEYQEPLARFRREQIQDTVVFFGSARFHGRSAASQKPIQMSSSPRPLQMPRKNPLVTTVRRPGKVSRR